MIAKEKNVTLVSLGCDKNTVDSEQLLYILKEAGFNITTNLENAHIIIVNTCAFILDAQKESIESILNVEQYKKNKCEKIIVCGCLVARNADELKQNFNSIDLLLNINEYDKIAEKIFELYGEKIEAPCQLSMPKRLLSTPYHYAYVKIADGCDNFCTYCTIPKIRGRFRSRKIEDIVEECKALVANGVKEIIIVAQDVTRYGIDLYNEYKLVELLKELILIENLKWIRLHYCYPELISDELIDLIANESKICKYIDIPLQHVDDLILKKMNRRSTYKSICDLIEKIQSKEQNIFIRSSFIVGFPFETSKEFQKLKLFVKKYKLNHVGVFSYSKEDGTPAASMKKQVSTFVKYLRRKSIYSIQKKIAKENNLAMIDKTLVCVCDSIENDVAILRNEYNSPNVDTVVYCDCIDGIEQGAFYEVKVVGFNEYDLVGIIQRRIEK